MSTEDRSPQGRGPQHTTHHDDCGCQSARLKASIAELEKENTILRALLVKHECPYGEQSLGACSRGFPGCACADDMLATASWCPEDEDKATVRLGRRIATLEAELSGVRQASATELAHAYAHAAMLRDAVVDALDVLNMHALPESSDTGTYALVNRVERNQLVMRLSALLAQTPAASLAAHDAEVIERCAKVCDDRAAEWRKLEDQYRERGQRDFMEVACVQRQAAESLAANIRALAAQEVKP